MRLGYELMALGTEHLDLPLIWNFVLAGHSSIFVKLDGELLVLVFGKKFLVTAGFALHG